MQGKELVFPFFMILENVYCAIKVNAEKIQKMKGKKTKEKKMKEKKFVDVFFGLTLVGFITIVLFIRMVFGWITTEEFTIFNNVLLHCISNNLKKKMVKEPKEMKEMEKMKQTTETNKTKTKMQTNIKQINPIQFLLQRRSLRFQRDLEKTMKPMGVLKQSMEM